MSLEDYVNGVVWLNGEYMDFASATVSIEDRGFVFGDGIYEVARVYNGKPFVLDRHLARLRRSAAARMAPPTPSSANSLGSGTAAATMPAEYEMV